MKIPYNINVAQAPTSGPIAIAIRELGKYATRTELVPLEGNRLRLRLYFDDPVELTVTLEGDVQTPPAPARKRGRPRKSR